MNFKGSRLVIAFFLATVLAFPVSASTPEPPTVPRDYVVDLAGIMASDAKSRLNAALVELEQKTTAQVLVLTVQSLDGQSIEEFAFTTKEKWKLGQKGKDNGVLVVVAMKDRKYRFEIGYGLEGVLPDSMVGTIGREYLVPYFRKGDYGTGIYAAVLVVIKTIAANEGVQITGLDDVRRDKPRRQEGVSLKDILLILLIMGPVIIGILSSLLRHSGKRSGRSTWWGNGYYGGFSNGGGSGGFGGFGGGSFGGGGGGSGGGGGASGGW